MTDHHFGGFILASIAVNSVLIALEDYKDPGRLNGNPNLRNLIVSPPISGISTSVSYSTRSPLWKHVVAYVSMAVKERDTVTASVHWLSRRCVKPALPLWSMQFYNKSGNQVRAHQAKTPKEPLQFLATAIDAKCRRISTQFR